MPVSNEQKILRILRLQVTDQPGYLAKIATILGELEANIGEISIVSQGPDYLVREISLQLKDEEHLKRIVAGIGKLDGVIIDDVTDPVELLHEGGKIGMKSRVPLNNINEMRKIYTPGVAQICKLIQKEPALSKRFTGISNSVGIITNGTAILGLGQIGPVAGMPVMEGKSVLFEQLVGISGIPILIESTKTDEVIDTIKAIATTFGAIQLEDIAAPECFEIEDKLQDLGIPVLHDDQHGTAIAVLAALITIARRVDLNLNTSRLGLIGLGAAGTGIARLLMPFGVKEILGADLRQDALDRLKADGGTPTTIPDLMSKADIVIATTGCPGLITPDMVRKGQVILALSNPDAEIMPEVALEHGASFAADGRTINNALAFPGLFRGALSAGAKHFTHKMKIAAANAIADQTRAKDIVPSILDRTLHQEVASAVEKAWNEEY